MEESLTFYVNGTKVCPGNTGLDRPLVQYLRQDLKLMGTKAACGSGYCGACTVMVSTYNEDSGMISHAAMNACLLPLASLHGKAVTTVEAVGSTRTKLHPVQQRLAESHGTQCGYCSPGMVMSVYALIRNKSKPSTQQLQDALAGNLCRCTGYRPILDGFMAFCQDCPLGEKCCQAEQKNDGDEEHPMTKDASTFDLDPSQEPIFPADLQLNASRYGRSSIFDSPQLRWYRPQSLRELLLNVDDLPSPVTVYGYIYKDKVKNTSDLNDEQRIAISCVNVRELNLCRVDDDGITVGSAVCISALEDALDEAMSSLSESTVYSEITEVLRNFIGKQYRNMMTIGDLLLNWSPDCTVLPVLICAGCSICVMDTDDNKRTINLQECLNGQKLHLSKKDVILSLHIPKPKEKMIIRCYRVTPRKRMAPASVTSCFQISLNKSDKVEDVCFVMSGLSDRMITSTNTSQYLIGKHLDQSVREEALNIFRGELPSLPSNDMKDSKMDLAVSSLFKFLCHLKSWTASKESLPEMNGSPIRGTRLYDLSPESVTSDLGHPIPHHSAPQHTTGEAEYVDDIPHVEGELSMAFVLSSVAHGKIISVDASRALALPGVVDFISSKDVIGSNSVCLYGVTDEEIFAEKEVKHVGAVIGAILADSAERARTAAQAVDVKYEVLPHILTTQEAIEVDSFYDNSHTISVGDTSKGFEEADFVVEDSVESGGQLHVPLEKGACLTIPKRGDNELEVWMSCHDITMLQGLIGSAINLPANKVYCRVKRIGGSFGGKEATPRRYALPAAVGAWKHMRPVRCVFSREEDIQLMSSRHPAFTKYKVGFTKEGKITALTLDVFLNAGSSLAISDGVLHTVVMHIDGAYKYPNFRVTGKNCKTNIISPTSFRGFGIPQGLFVTSSVIRRVARHAGISVTQVQKVNMLCEGDCSHTGQKMNNFFLNACWDEVMKQSTFDERKREVDQFNRANKHVKRGVTVEPWKFGIEYPFAFLNQGGALVNIYTDGTVLITHGGVEMGQGLHTKLIQKACLTLNERLEPIKSAKPNACWEDLVSVAFFSRINLSATGFHDYPDKQTFDMKNPKRTPNTFGYYTTGCVCTEVEVDLLTGMYSVLRTDIVMDVGKSLNPAIDVGQIEGGFVQGAGFHTIEEVKWSRDGRLVTDNYNSYFIPTWADVPQEFNITLLKESNNPRAVYSSKGVGEPPFMAGSSVLFAIQDALYSALDARGQTDVCFVLNSPATVEKVHHLCQKYKLNDCTE